MDVIPASVDEIAVFKKAAADYYKSQNIPPEKAAELFEKYMAKVAGEMGLAEQPKLTKKANDLATKLATQFGRKRPAA